MDVSKSCPDYVNLSQMGPGRQENENWDCSDQLRLNYRFFSLYISEFKKIILFSKIAFATMGIHDLVTTHVRWSLGISAGRGKINCRRAMGKSPHSYHAGTKGRLHIYKKV